MTLRNYLQFVEIQTKAASIIPFILGGLYSIYRYKSFSTMNFFIMLISLLTFDMATTAINNYIDYKKSLKTLNHNLESKNDLVREGITTSTALIIIFTLLTTATILGIILVIGTNVIVLLIGVLSFLAGILYTFGPIPISRMPLGELFSGFFMGFIILFLSIYIHIYDQNIINVFYSNNILSLDINILKVFDIFLLSIPTITGIANIMLANNICDVDEDILNKRFTLSYYIGHRNSLLLFKFLYYIGFIDIIILVTLRIAPIATLLVLVTFIPISKNIKLFLKKQSKSETFALSVKNFIIFSLVHIISILIMIATKYINEGKPM